MTERHPLCLASFCVSSDAAEFARSLINSRLLQAVPVTLAQQYCEALIILATAQKGLGRIGESKESLVKIFKILDGVTLRSDAEHTLHTDESSRWVCLSRHFQYLHQHSI